VVELASRLHHPLSPSHPFLPLLQVGKLLILGHAFGCLEECLVIAAALSNKSFFARPFKSEMKAYK